MRERWKDSQTASGKVDLVEMVISPSEVTPAHLCWIYGMHVQIKEDYVSVCMTIKVSLNVDEHNKMDLERPVRVPRVFL